MKKKRAKGQAKVSTKSAVLQAYENCVRIAEAGARAYRKMEDEEDSKKQAMCYRNSAAACKVIAKNIREVAGIKIVSESATTASDQVRLPFNSSFQTWYTA